MSENPIIELQNIFKSFKSATTTSGQVTILKGVSLQINPGEFTGVIGPSGSGKSTMINMMTGIDRPTSGNITVLGQTISDMGENALAQWRGKNVGIIFQFFQLLPTLSARENVMLPMNFCGIGNRKERAERARYCLEVVGMADHADKLPATLSGGQQQRVAIARALANDPPLLIGDEPTGNLDSKTGEAVFSLFESLVEQGKTIVMVTHDRGIADKLPRVIEVLDGMVVESVRNRPGVNGKDGRNSTVRTQDAKTTIGTAD
jgi:putative ABC transport system ATP-binding protein